LRVGFWILKDFTELTLLERDLPPLCFHSRYKGSDLFLSFIFTIQNARSDRFTSSKTFRIVGVLWFLEKTNSIITPKIRSESELAKMRLLK